MGEPDGMVPKVWSSGDQRATVIQENVSGLCREGHTIDRPPLVFKAGVHLANLMLRLDV